MKKIKNLTKRIFNAKRVGTLAMLLFCGVAATYAQNAAGDYTAGTNALTTVTGRNSKVRSIRGEALLCHSRCCCRCRSSAFTLQ